MINNDFLDRLVDGLDYRTLHDMVGSPRNVKLFIGSHPEVPSNVKEYVDKNWDVEFKKNSRMRDGDSLGINDRETSYDEEDLSLPLYLTKYRYIIGTRFNQTPGFQVNLLGSGAVTILKAEGIDYLLFGKRAPHLVSVGGRVEVIPQGGLKKEDLDKDAPLDVALLREAQGEVYNPVGLEVESDRVKKTMMALTITPYWNSVAMDYLLRLNDDRWLGRLDRQDRQGYSVLTPRNLTEKSEHLEFYAVPRESLVDFVQEHLEAKDEEKKLGVATRNRLKIFLGNERLL